MILMKQWMNIKDINYSIYNANNAKKYKKGVILDG